MDTDLIVVWSTGLLLAVLATVPVVLRMRRRERETSAAESAALRYGLHEPASLHPLVDPERCIGISNCVEVCPEGVIGVRDGQAVAVTPARCIGHGLCERVCPMEAIRLVFGTETRGVELPRIKGNFETNVPGLYIVGELGGMGLVANAFEQGRQCVEGITREAERGPSELPEILVVGCGPAGLSASLTARHHGMSVVTLEREDVGGTVRHYPRKKLVMTRPVAVPGWGKLRLREITKESLIETWEEIVGAAELDVRTGETVSAVERIAPLHFRVTTDRGIHEAARVILAIGRRGVPRKLGVPGEASPNVFYTLREPEVFTNDRIVVVGGGDSAVEAALALSEQPGNEVRVSYRKQAFSRIKPGNLDRIEDAIERRAIEVLWSTEPTEIRPGSVRLTGSERSGEVPADQLFVFIGGQLPTGFLRECGVEIETKFGEP